MIRTVEQQYAHRVMEVILVGVVTLEDLRAIGDFLDLPCTLTGKPKLAAQARRIARQSIQEYLRHGGSAAIARVAERSWAIADIYHQELDQAEFKLNIEFKVA